MHVLCRLIPPRPTFAHDMTDAEAKIMQAHAAYWQELAERGTAVVFGPVADPNGVWGLGIVQVEDETDLQALTSNDPAVTSGIGTRYEILPMVRAVIGKKRT